MAEKRHPRNPSNEGEQAAEKWVAREQGVVERRKE